MIPVTTAGEMRAVDAEAPEPVEVLVERAGAAVARAALAVLGGAYGRRVVVVAGKGNNGADGRVAARRLTARGARVAVVEAAEAEGARLPAADLVVDAAYGTGFRGEWTAPDPAGAPVLAVDVPSGLNADTGEAGPGAVRADATVTFAAWKPGLLLGRGPELAGRVEVADLGLDVGRARAHVVEDADVAARLPPRPREAHKWEAAVFVVAGSPGMMGAASLSSGAAFRAGAGYVLLGSPGVRAADSPGGEAVAVGLPPGGWDEEVLPHLARCQALAVGPGLGRAPATVAAVRRLVAEAPVPVVLDADGLFAVGDASGLAELVAGRARPTVVTPHGGEFARLTGSAPPPDRIEAVRRLAGDSGAVVLLKGPTTVVGAPDGSVLLSTTGTPALATAGTGDVLTGVIAAFLASGLDAPWAAAAGAHAHGAAARLGHRIGLVASDLHALVPRWLSAVTR